MKKPIIIEFTGLPGAGKTTIAEKVVSDLNGDKENCPKVKEVTNANFNSRRLLRKYIDFTLFVLKERKTVSSIVRFALSVKPYNSRSLIRILNVLRTMQLISIMKKTTYDYVVLEQGIIQNLWSIAISGQNYSKEKLMDVISRLDSYIDVVILVALRPEEANSRVHSRKSMNSRLDNMSADKSLDILTKHNKFFYNILGQVKSKEMQHLVIEGTEEIDYNVKLVNSYLKKQEKIY